MTVQSNLDSAVVDLKAEFDSMSFLDPGVKTEVDQDLIDDIQTDIETLVTNYSAEFEGTFDNLSVEIDAETLCHWLFDGQTHSLIVSLYPTNASEGLIFTSVIPFPWR